MPGPTEAAGFAGRSGAGGREEGDFVVVDVASGGDGYPVVIGSGVLDRLPSLVSRYAAAARYAVISDSNVAPLYGAAAAERLALAGMRADPFTFPAGEASKNRDSWARLTDAMLSAGFGRDSCVIAVGGGVVGDLAGFVAATYMRGVPVVQVPTSLVAMVDASVGGKTGIDVPAGKNLVGAFHPPRLVAVDPGVIRSLPREERSNGMAEAVKHGAILDGDYFDRIDGAASEILDGEAAAVLRTVLRSISLKARIVGRDEREGGVRRILNFGHTAGHAIEASSGYALPHGAAVALGMILEARLGEKAGVTAEGTSERLERVLARLELPVTPSHPLDVRAVLQFLKADKKGEMGTPRYVLLSRIGEADPGRGWLHEIPEALVEAELTLFSGSPADSRRPG